MLWIENLAEFRLKFEFDHESLGYIGKEKVQCLFWRVLSLFGIIISGTFLKIEKVKIWLNEFPKNTEVHFIPYNIEFSNYVGLKPIIRPVEKIYPAKYTMKMILKKSLKTFCIKMTQKMLLTSLKTWL